MSLILILNSFVIKFFKSLISFGKHLIRSSKHGLYYVVKVIFWNKWWWWCGNSGGFIRWSEFLTVSRSCVCWGRKNEEYSFLGLYIALFCFKIKVLLKIVVICRYLNCKRVSLCVRVFHSQLFILVYRRSSIPRHLEMFLM